MHTQGNPLTISTRDGRTLHATMIEPSGWEGYPTVVFEAGSGGTRSSWGLVQPLVGEFARTIAYDRAGLGRSPEDPTVRTLDRMADDLNDVLDQLGTGPFILVGHSAGGPIVRLAASNARALVTALVLVEPSDESADVLFTARFRLLERSALLVGSVLARLGLLHRLFRSTLEAMPADVRDDLKAEAFTPRTLHTQARQAKTFLHELRAWRDNPPRNTTPTTVLSGALPGDGMSASMRAAATESHRLRAEQSTSGVHLIASNSAHNIPVTEPHVVADVIQLIIAS